MQYHYAKIGSGIEEYRTNRSGICPDNLIIMNSPPPLCKWIANSDGSYSEVEKTASELAQIAQSEIITELNWCDLQINLHASSDKRAVSTIDDIYAHARACRDYVQNVDGELTIVGDKPVRPT